MTCFPSRSKARAVVDVYNTPVYFYFRLAPSLLSPLPCSLLLRVYSPQLPVKTAAANRLLQGFHKRRDLEAVFKVCTGNRKSHEPLTRCSRARSLSNDSEARPRARHARMNPTTEWAALQWCGKNQYLLVS